MQEINYASLKTIESFLKKNKDVFVQKNAYDGISNFPTVGKDGDIYIDRLTNKTYRWDDKDAKYYCIDSERGSVINYGTEITGTSTTATVFSSSGLASSLVNDLYIHTTTFNIYRCTNAGNASVAKWVYVGCLKGAKGDKGADGTNATTTAVATTSANGLMSKDMVTKLNGIATGAINVVESADEPTNQNTGDLWFELVEEISL